MGAIHQTTGVWWWLQRHFPKPDDWNKSSRRCAQELNTPQLELGNFERDDMMHRRENSQQLCSRRMNIHWLHSTKQKYKKKKNKNRCFRLILNYIGIHYDDDSTGISRQAKNAYNSEQREHVLCSFKNIFRIYHQSILRPCFRTEYIWSLCC